MGRGEFIGLPKDRNKASNSSSKKRRVGFLGGFFGDKINQKDEGSKEKVRDNFSRDF